MLLNIRRYHTLLAFVGLVGCSGAYVACGSDDEVAPGAGGAGGRGGTGGAAGAAASSNGDAMSDGMDDEEL